MKTGFMKYASAALLLSASQMSPAALIGGVEFPQGAISFADAAVSYSAGLAGNSPTAPHQNASNALGVPDYDGINGCAATCSFVSLGVGGELVLRFVDNFLTGSDSDDDDLWIFEIGPDVEGTVVDISKDGLDWLSVGSIGGSTRGIDIDAFGYGTTDLFSFVRLTDIPGNGATTGASVGADINAVGAISTRPAPPIPEPATWAMMIAGFGLVGGALRNRARAALSA